MIQWLWQTLESFTIEERVLFLRFVSGRSRLPTRVSEIPQRFQISVASGQVYMTVGTPQNKQNNLYTVSNFQIYISL